MNSTLIKLLGLCEWMAPCGPEGVGNVVAGQEHVMLTPEEVRKLFGGSKPIGHVTLWKMVKDGRCPKPVRIGRTTRYIKLECEEALQKLIEARNAEAA